MLAGPIRVNAAPIQSLASTRIREPRRKALVGGGEARRGDPEHPRPRHAAIVSNHLPVQAVTDCPIRSDGVEPHRGPTELAPHDVVTSRVPPKRVLGGLWWLRYSEPLLSPVNASTCASTCATA